MASEGKSPGLKQLKVDNWAQFFVQRLQLLFAKGDACDLTLKFFTGQELKVHSIVLRTCTSHFETLPKTDNVITLPETLSYATIFPIINFMYSGKLEFKPEIQAQLLTVVKILNITILIKLLLAQRDGPAGTTVKAKAVTGLDGGKGSQLIVQQSTPSTSGLLPGKKLPFWRKRSVPLIKYSDRKPVEDEPGPTRFHWPETESTDLVLLTSPSFSGLSYEQDPIIRAPPKVEIDRTNFPTRRIIESRMLATHDSDDDDDRFDTVYSSDEESSPTPPPPPVQPPAVLKPCLKTPSVDSPSPSQSKRVRFSLTPDGKENVVSTTISSSNHAKIIAEVLKKYPDLVKNKNIKLKISSPKPKVENGVNNDEKASYVVLKPSGSLRTGLLTATPTNKGEASSGPWYCDHCPEIKFELYQDYHKHILEAHGEKLDARICEYCGYKAAKRNLHLFHLFTKHNVPPPKNISFPKCPKCPYVALSEILLAKHVNTHQQTREPCNKERPKEFECDMCHAVLKNEASLCAHKVTCKPPSGPRNIICDLCKTAFRTNVNLNAHLKECQGKPEPTTIYQEDGQAVEMIEVPIIEAVNVEKANHTLVQLPPGLILADNQNMALLPTTSAGGSLNGVTSNLTSSIALAIPQPDQQTAVILLQGNGPEYIVPEFLDGSSFTAGNITYTTAQNQVIYLGGSPGNEGQQEVIHLEEIKISQESPCTSTIEETDKVPQPELSLPIINSEDGEKPQVSGQEIVINVQDSIVETSADPTSDAEVIFVRASKPEENKSLQVRTEVTINRDQNIVTHQSSDAEVIQACENLIKSEKSFHNESLNNKELKRCRTYMDSKTSNETEPKTKRPSPPENVLQKCVPLDSSNITLPDNIQNETVCENETLQSTSISIHCSSNEIVSEMKPGRAEEISVDTLKHNVSTAVPNQVAQNLEIIEKIDLTVDENSSEVIKIEDESSRSETEQMQVDEGREEMVVDEKDEEMDVEENTDANKEIKDAMDVEESVKTGDERVNNLVKDWGFDDEEIEEVIDDPASKPLRSDMNLPM